MESQLPQIDYGRPSPDANRSVRTGLVVLGIALVLAGAGFAALFKVAVVTPAYTPLPGGEYGETYGPVSMLRVPVYLLCGSLVLGGIACIGVGARVVSRRRG